MWYWWVGGGVALAASAVCIVSTVFDLKRGKCGPNGPKAAEFWGAVAFHGVTALLAIWLLGKVIV